MRAAHGLSFADWDWNFILGAAITSGFGYLGKNFLSDTNGKVGGMIG